MSVRTKKWLLILALAVLCSCSRPSHDTSPPVRVDKRTSVPEAPQFEATVSRVLDGDTVDVIDNHNESHRIRLQGIDSPEMRQPFADESRRNLANLIEGRRVNIEWQKIIRDRIIGKISFNGFDVCLEQTKAGFAWHYKDFQDEQTEADRRLYSEAERVARTHKWGLWIDAAPIPPWEFRHGPRIGSNGDGPTNAVPSPNHTTAGQIWGSKRTMIYHWPGCPNYDDIALHNRVPFKAREEAERAGYRAARNCG